MKNLLASTILFLAISAGHAMAADENNDMKLPDINNPRQREQFVEIIKEKLIETAKNLTPQLPQKLNEDTTMQSVTVSGLNIVYSNELSRAKDQIDVEALRKQILNNSCQMRATQDDYSRELSKLQFALGYTQSYVYHDRNGELVTTVTLNKDTCKL